MLQIEEYEFARRPQVENCNDCGACCANVQLALTSEEAAPLVAAGTKLVTILPPWDHLAEDVDGTEQIPLSWADDIGTIVAHANKNENPSEKRKWLGIARHAASMKPGEGLFGMVGPCGFLDQQTKKCLNYEGRPTICRTFPTGGLNCMKIREAVGIEAPVQLVPKPIA